MPPAVKIRAFPIVPSPPLPVKVQVMAGATVVVVIQRIPIRIIRTIVGCFMHHLLSTSRLLSSDGWADHSRDVWYLGFFQSSELVCHRFRTSRYLLGSKSVLTNGLEKGTREPLCITGSVSQVEMLAQSFLAGHHEMFLLSSIDGMMDADLLGSVNGGGEITSRTVTLDW